MRIVHFVDALTPGGVTTVISNLVTAQAAEHDVSVALLQRSSTSAVRIHPFRVTTGTEAMRTLLRADVVHSHHRTCGLLASGMPGVATVDHVHNLFTNRKHLSFRGDRVVAVSHSVAAHTAEIYPHVRERISVIENAIPTPDPRWKRRIPDTPEILGIGRLDHQKDPLAFVRLVSELRRDCPDLKARWIGDGPLKADFLALSRSLGVHNILRHQEWSSPDEIAEALANSSALMITSAWEGFPMTAIEAFALGVPVFSTRVGSLSETLATVSDHLELAVGTPALLSDSVSRITELLLSPDRLREVGLALESVWRTRFEITDASDRWNLVYASIV